MNEPWLALLLVFASAALAVLFVHRFISRDYAAKREVNRRLSLIEQIGDQREALAILRRERGVAFHGGWHWLDGLQNLFMQSGLRFCGMNFLLAVAGLSASLTVAISTALGFSWLNVILAIATTILLTFIYVRRARERRVLRFNEQLADVIDLIVRSLKAGHPLPVSLLLVAQEMPDPAGTEFGIASDEVTYGQDVPTAFQNLSRRVGDPDLLFLVMATTIQAQTGGNLVEILSRLSKVIRDRFKLRRKVLSLTAEGRFSAIALTVMPFALYGIVSLIAPAYYGEVRHEPVFRAAMSVGLVLLLIGNFVMRRMVKFKY
jgi:tight adherence protein B